jgi:hypothetical protein
MVEASEELGQQSIPKSVLRTAATGHISTATGHISTSCNPERGQPVPRLKREVRASTLLERIAPAQ